MRTSEVIERIKRFKDFYGGDIPDTTNLRTKEDCRKRLEAHRRLMEETLNDAMSHLDDFERKLGIY